MVACDWVVRDVRVADGSGGPIERRDVAVRGGWIVAVGVGLEVGAATEVIEGAELSGGAGEGCVLAPGFIDVHTHDDTAVLRWPEMLPKVSQGVTTAVVGNCGVSVAPVRRGAWAEPPDPMNLLGETAETFRYGRFAEYAEAVGKARPAVNVVALVGHTTLRANWMDRLDRTATAAEIAGMRGELEESLAAGAVGLSTGLAYLSANAATTAEVLGVAEGLRGGGIYTTHLRTETEGILEAMEEAFGIGRAVGVPVLVSHVKCAGVANWGRSGEVLAALEAASEGQAVNGDCYPYAAGSSTLDLRQVDERVRITITWSRPHAEMAGRTLGEIAGIWGVAQREAAERLQPAGAIYHSIAEEDMRRILAHPAVMVGSDGLPLDPLPHPRLWGTFPRVLGRYCREMGLFSLPGAVRKMTGLPAERFGLRERGLVREGYRADLVLFDPETVRDRAEYGEPAQVAEGIRRVWVNGVSTYADGALTGERAGRFLAGGRG